MRKSTFATLAAVAAAMLSAGAALAATCPGPDTFGHRCTDNPTACVATGTTTDIGGTLFDDSCIARSIGFTARIFGTAYTTVGVASNGYLDLGGCNFGTDFSNDCPIPTTFTENEAIYGVWDDLNNGGVANRIRDGLSGVAPNRIYTAEWIGVPYFSGSGSVSFQIQIHENGGGTNESIVRIRQTNVSQNTSYTSGLENATGTDGITRYCNNGITGLFCTEYSASPVTPPGSCDLTPVLNAIARLETKADTNATAVNRLEGKADAGAAAQNRAEAKLDALPNVINNAVADIPCQVYRLLSPRLPGEPSVAGSKCLGLLPSTCPGNLNCAEQP